MKIFLITAVVLLVLAFFFLPLPGSATVLMYHFLGTEELARERGNFVSEKTFARQLEFLDKLGYSVISMDDYYANLSGKRKAGFKEIVISFDDGNYTYETKAFPMLQKHGFQSTIFVVSESVEEVIRASMSRETIQKLLDSGLVTVGGHSRTHPLLTRLNEEQITEELAGSKQDLESMFHVPVDFLAYPSGDVDEKVARIAKETGYKLAFTTSHKNLEGLGITPWTLTRVKINEKSANPVVFWFKISGIYEQFKRLRYAAKSAF